MGIRSVRLMPLILFSRMEMVWFLLRGSLRMPRMRRSILLNWKWRETGNLLGRFWVNLASLVVRDIYIPFMTEIHCVYFS